MFLSHYYFVDERGYLRPLGSRMFVCTAAEGATSDVVPQLLDELRVLLLDLLSELLPTDRDQQTSHTLTVLVYTSC